MRITNEIITAINQAFPASSGFPAFERLVIGHYGGIDDADYKDGYRWHLQTKYGFRLLYRPYDLRKCRTAADLIEHLETDIGIHRLAEASGTIASE